MTFPVLEPLDPSDLKDYTIDFSVHLGTSDTIASVTSVTCDNATVDSYTNDTGVVTVWLNSGTLGTRATATAVITSALGRVISQSIQVQVRDT